MINDWILSGCDERIALRHETDANQYHLNPTKFEGLLMRGSCTCGTLTPDCLKTAQRFQQEYRPSDDRRWIQEQAARLRALFDG